MSDIVDFFVCFMFVLAIASTVFSIVLIKKHPEVLDEKKDQKKRYWQGPPL